MSNLVNHAIHEMKLAQIDTKDSDYGGMLYTAVLELIQKFAEQNHSGASAAITLDLFTRLAKFLALTPLTSSPTEWHDVSGYGSKTAKPLWQNIRQSSCFSNDGGFTYYDIDDPERKLCRSTVSS